MNSKQVKPNGAQLAEMLNHIMLMSCGAALMRFELASKETKRQVSGIIMQSVRTNTLIGQDSISSLSSLQLPTGYTVHCMEQSMCMFCKQRYYGKVHPDFGIYCHEKCLEPNLWGHQRVMESYPIKRLLQTLPFRARSGKFYFMSHRHAGFPAISLQEWAEQQSLSMDDMIDTIDTVAASYKASNATSNIRVKNEKNAVWKVTANATLQRLGYPGAYSGIIKRLPYYLASRVPLGVGDPKEAATEALSSLKLQDKYGYEVAIEIVLSAIAPEKWSTLQHLDQYAPLMAGYHGYDIYHIVEFLDTQDQQRLATVPLREALKRKTSLEGIKALFE